MTQQCARYQSIPPEKNLPLSGVPPRRCGYHQACAPAACRFTLDPMSSRPIVLLGAGIGITPLLSMLYTLRERQPERTVVLGYAVRNGQYHAFADEIAHLVRDRTTIFYEQPAVEDEQAGRFDRAGRIDAAWLQEQVPQE